MDTTTTIIGLCLFLLAVTPVIIASQRSKKKRLNLKRKFDELISKNDLQLIDQEDIDGKLVGIDSIKKMLIFVSSRVPNGIVIDLKKEFKLDILRSKSDGLIDLRVRTKGNTESEFHLPFFDPDKDDLLRFEYFGQKAEKWFKLINHT